MMRFAMITQHLSSAGDSISVCAFIFGASFQLYTPEQLVQAINAVMGWNVDMEEILEVGERRPNMLRAFNSKEGVGRESDTLPKKMFKRPLKGGRSDGYVLNEEEWENCLLGKLLPLMRLGCGDRTPVTKKDGIAWARLGSC
ncbi:MAG: hypothetical protein Ct9H300mP28_23930 [Pseudomonadota bacterium]|nr:MAG: hypothetical protein Ct9H300mP28_23930 [Pseudomonadota bacterium]